MKFAHISDTHLGYRQFNENDREMDFYKAFEESVEKMIREKVDFVVHSGDLFEHYRTNPRAFMVVINALEKLKGAEIPVYSIAGNHDIILRRGMTPPQRILERIGLLRLVGDEESKWYVHDGIFICGIWYKPKFYRRMMIEKLNRLSKMAEGYEKRILMMHQSIKKYFPLNYEIDISEVPRNFDYIAMGHLHNRIVDRYGRGYIAYSGSIEVWRKDEVESFIKNGKGFYVVELDDEVSIRKVDLESIRPFLVEEVNVESFSDDLEDVAKKVEEVGRGRKKPVLYVEIRGVKERDPRYYLSEIEEAISGKVLRFIPIYRFEESGGIRGGIEAVDRDKIFDEVFEDKEVSELAKSLFRLLKENEVEEAIKVVDKFYEDNKGKLV
ncbi:MAG: exonuclease SbcCD subunit D [Candidatus Odinarchaeota archaeon]|nr:exonuclease SbcCD subunit D [Candidatus Odinarchaeota archaeon]